MKRVAVALLLMACISGCAVNRHMGNENLKPELVATVQKGKTSKQDLLAMFGPPQTTSFRKLATGVDPAVKLPPYLTAGETWSYWSHSTEGTAVVVPFYAQTNTTSSNYVVSFFFDDQGTVVDYTSTQSNF